MSVNVSSSQTDGETKLNDILKKRFTNARLINVKDTSCKYRIYFKKKHNCRWNERIFIRLKLEFLTTVDQNQSVSLDKITDRYLFGYSLTWK
jgi:hypothetical protein